jgi:penicillin-binding protein 1A
MRKVLIWSVRLLGALVLVAFLFAGAVAGRIYWLATDGMPDYRLVDGASSWHGCIPPDAGRVEFVPLSAMPANAINAFLAVAEPDFLTREAYNPITDVLRRLWRGWLLGVKGGWASLGNSPISVAYVNQLLFCLNNPAGDRALPRFKDALLRYRIERDLPRRSILETVINTDYLRSGAYGMPAAALRYFQKPLTELSTGELAFLASAHGSVPFQVPRKYMDLPLERRNAFLKEAEMGRNIILDRMARMGALTVEQAAPAKLEPLNLQPQN